MGTVRSELGANPSGAPGAHRSDDAALNRSAAGTTRVERALISRRDGDAADRSPPAARTDPRPGGPGNQPVTRPMELSLIYYRKGYCELINGALKDSRVEYREAVHDFEKAIELLRAARASFLSLSMAHDAGLAGLDLADALIANGQFDSARQLVQDVLHEFINKKLNHRAVTALSYLHDALRTTPQPRSAVDHVRTYLKRLRYEPERIFLPPPEE